MPAIDCDLDGVICEEVPTFERALAKPLKDEIEALKKLKERGFTIFIHTARSWAEYEMTLEWLKKNKVPFDSLICGKVVAKYRVDDRSFVSISSLLNKLESEEKPNSPRITGFANE